MEALIPGENDEAFGAANRRKTDPHANGLDRGEKWSVFLSRTLLEPGNTRVG